MTVFHVIFVALAAAVAALYAVKPIKDWLERRRMRRWVRRLMADGMSYGEAVEQYLLTVRWTDWEKTADWQPPEQ